MTYWAQADFKPEQLPMTENWTIGERVIQDGYTFPFPIREKLAIELLQLMPAGRWIGYLCPDCRLNEGVLHSFEYLALDLEGRLWFVCCRCGVWKKTNLRLKR